MNKEFFELTNYMGSLENKLQMQHAVRAREADLKFQKEKEGLINGSYSKDDLASRLESLEAAYELEKELSH